MSAADEVLKLREDLQAITSSYHKAALERDQYRNELNDTMAALELESQSAADARKDLVQAKTERDNAEAARLNAQYNASQQTRLANWMARLSEDKDKAITQLREKLIWWRVMAIAEGLMLLGVWANTYLFGGAA